MRKDTTGKGTSKTFLPIYKERSAPYKAFLFYALLGSGLLFLALSIMFIVWNSQQITATIVQFPKSFVISTLALLFSSYTLSISRNYHLQDQAQNMLLTLTASLLLSLVFIAFQVHAVFSILDQGLYVNFEVSLLFLYIITGFHFLHIVVGTIYLFYLNLKSFDIWKDPVKSLIYFSNKFEGLRFELFCSYWYFSTGLWLFLFLVFFYSL
ncbi:MAG: cytochrome c oxidase subunit 3 [Bacteroidetes bacterium]|jgi:cytochrome c oxidase subunit 3|nr:cytochrome c oxidase subunit 3 [Bacteroidota bacterium]